MFACGDRVKRPDNIIEKDAFAAILADIHLVEANYLSGRDVPDTMQAAYLRDYNRVFEIHGVDRATFFANFKYYSAQPRLLEQIYDRVHTRLQIQQDQMIHSQPREIMDTTDPAG
jgi:hypothetical protein